MAKKIIAILLMLTMSVPLHAENLGTLAQAKGLTTEEKAELSGTRKQLATIVFAGLAGAILGLSTLSFHGRPQDHLSSIAVGFAFGVIGGATYTTYKAATHPYEAYDVASDFQDENFKQFLAQENSHLLLPVGWAWSF
jgi:uncharacterized membrane protein YebE (DUF533 family)